ncbi:PPC domain-containing protein, partial [Aliikangiella maris]
GRYYVRLKAYSNFSGVTLKGSYTGSTTPPPPPPPPPGGKNELQNGVAQTNLSAATGDALVYTFNVPSGATDIRFDMSGGTGDADLYTRFGSEPTDATYDCRPYKSG